MGITIVTPATDHLLTTVERIKVELGLSSGDDDLLIESYIEQMSAQIASFTGRTFAKEQVKETMGASGVPEILLSLTPIVSVEGITFDGVAVTDFSILNDKAGILFREVGWTDTSIPWNTFDSHPSPYKRPDWEFTYTGGYVLPNWQTVLDPRTLPFDLERACIDMIKILYKGKSLDSSVKRYRVGDTDVSFDKEAGLFTPTIRSVLSFYGHTV